MITKCKVRDKDPDISNESQVWCVYSADGSKLLGRHATREEAEEQLRAIEANKKDINLKPTTGMAEEAKRGLAWRKEFNRGGTAVGVARAAQLQRRENLSPSTVKRMHSFFSRHEGNKKAEGFRQGEKGYPSAGRIAWALWGGDAGQSWARGKVRQLDNQEKSVKAEDQYSTRAEAEEAAEKIGCSGSHTMEDGDQTIYMPCDNHNTYERMTGDSRSDGYKAVGQKSFDFNVKNIEGETTEINGVPVKSFEGYASVFNNVDRVGDMVMQGAFSKQSGERIILMHNHRTNVGVADIIEDDKGLFVKGYINQEIQAGREGYSLLKMGAVNKMSFGYEVKGSNRAVKDGKEYQELTELKAHEVSFVDFPANPQTTITAVKSNDCNCTKTQDSEIIKSLKLINQGLINSIKSIKE